MAPMDHHRRRQLDAGDAELLLEVTRRLATAEDLAALLHHIVDASCTLLGAERASVWLHDAARDCLVLEVSRDLHAVRLPLGVGIVGSCAQQRQTINVPDCYADPRFDFGFDRASGFHTHNCLAVPLLAPDGALVGALQILNKRTGAFDEDDEGLAAALAAQCAVALERARMVERLLDVERVRQEMALAEQMQRCTLPARLPVVPGYAMHGVFRPADATGGDTYDLALVGPQLLLLLGDATGHGVGAALSVVQMHAMLRLALGVGAPLEQAYRAVNDRMAETLPEGRFVTVFAGLLDPSTHRLRFVSGGHAPILLQRAKGQGVAWARLGATTFPMGAMPLRRPVVPTDLQMAPGDLLAVVSDGILEAEDKAGQPFGVARTEALLADRGAPLDRLADTLLASLDAHVGPRGPQDDVSLVLVRREAA